jgi:hypothetical protein
MSLFSWKTVGSLRGFQKPETEVLWFGTSLKFCGSTILKIVKRSELKVVWFQGTAPTLVEMLGGYINGILIKHWENTF